MIRGLHAMLYTSQAAELRAFLRDKLGFEFTDVGEGWLIFQMPKAELGCHPIDEPGSPPSGTHYLAFYCDDIEATVSELRDRGVEFTDEISDVGYGLAIHFQVPGGFDIELYEPRYRL